MPDSNRLNSVLAKSDVNPIAFWQVVQMGVEPTKSRPSEDRRFAEGLRTAPF